jgi:hypothetical protein
MAFENRVVDGVLDLRADVAPFVPDLGMLEDLEHLREPAMKTWAARMVNEYRSSFVFDALAKDLAEAGFSDDEVRQCEGFADEERRHGVLCASVCVALGGEARAEVPDAPAYPRHEDTSPREAVLQNLLSISCMSETVAVALIGAERLEMPDGPLRDLLTGIWADEVGHARFGWGVVARAVKDLDAPARARLGAFLAMAFAHVETHELAHLPAEAAPPPEGVRLGLCSGGDARTLFYDTITTVVIPRLEVLGLPAKRAWALRHDLAA